MELNEPVFDDYGSDCDDETDSESGSDSDGGGGQDGAERSTIRAEEEVMDASERKRNGAPKVGGKKPAKVGKVIVEIDLSRNAYGNVRSMLVLDVPSFQTMLFDQNGCLSVGGRTAHFCSCEFPHIFLTFEIEKLLRMREMKPFVCCLSRHSKGLLSVFGWHY